MTTETVKKPDPFAKARAVQAERRAAAKAAAQISPAVPTPDPRIEEMLSLIRQQSDELAKLRDKVAAAEGAVPQFVKMKPAEDPRRDLAGTYVPPEAAMKRAMKRLTSHDQNASGGTSYLDTPAGRAKLPPQYMPVYRSGDRVTLNPDAPVWGGGGKTWGETLAIQGINPGVGEVLSVHSMTKTWEPKYNVVIPGLTRPVGDGFRESELLPA